MKTINAKKILNESTILFLIALSINLYMAHLLVFKGNYSSREAITRTSQVADLIRSYGQGERGLAASVLRDPLPILLQLPLQILKPLTGGLFLNNIVSVLSAALTFILLNKAFRLFSLTTSYRYLLLALYQLNPRIFFYSINGSREMLFLLLVTASLYSLLVWSKNESLGYLSLTGLTTSLVLLTKQEGLLYAIFMLLILFFILHFDRRSSLSKKEGSLLIYLAPVVYSISLCFLFSWLITSDILYFLRETFLSLKSTVSMLSPSLEPAVRASSKSISTTSVFVNLLIYFPFFGFVCLLLGINFLKRKDNPSLYLLSLIFAFPLFSSLVPPGQHSSGTVGDIIYVFPLSYLFLAKLIGDLKRPNIRLLFLKYALVSLLILSTIFGLYRTGGQLPEKSDDYTIILSLLRGEKIGRGKEEIEIVSYLEKHKKGSKIWIYGPEGYRIIAYVTAPEIFIHTLNTDFQKILVDNRAKDLYVLVPRPRDMTGSETVNPKFPIPYERATEFTLLDKAFDNWRLYRVIRPEG